MKSGSCVKPGGWRWWVGPSFPLGRASGENLVQTGTAPFGYQPLPGTSVPMTHPWYSEVQGQDDVGGGGAAWRGSAWPPRSRAVHSPGEPQSRLVHADLQGRQRPAHALPRRHPNDTPSPPPGRHHRFHRRAGLSLGELLSGLRLEPPTHLDAATPRRHPATGPSQSR